MKIEAFREQMLRSVGYKIPGWALVYKGIDRSTNEYLWSLYGAVTDRPELLHVSAQHVAAQCIPRSVQESLDHYVRMRNLLEYHARDTAPLSGDLNPISPEERNLFSARVIEPNPLFPKVEKIRRRIGDYDHIYRSRGLD